MPINDHLFLPIEKDTSNALPIAFKMVQFNYIQKGIIRYICECVRFRPLATYNEPEHIFPHQLSDDGG